MILTLRDARPEDAELLAHLTREAWAGKVAPDSSGHRETPERVRADLASGGGLVMELGGEPVGSVRWRALPEAWEVMRLGLLPAYRGRGLSTWLMNELTYRALTGGAPELRLAVRTDQPRLAEYYEGLGFAADPGLEYSRANPDNPPPVVMRKRLYPYVPAGELL